MNLDAKKHPLPLLITMGDPNGVGPEICAQAWQHYSGDRPLCLLGDFQVMRRAIEFLELPIDLYAIDDVEKTPVYHPRKMFVLKPTLTFGDSVEPGQVTAHAGEVSIAYVRQAVELLKAHKASAMVTAPLSKEAVEKTVPGFQGHTEYIGELCGDPQPVLCLVHGNWVVAHVSTHVSLKEAVERVQKERIIKTTMLLKDFLEKYYHESSVRIGMAGLNPHAGENGLFGREEIDEIIPAVNTLKEMGCCVEGPLPGDVLFPQLKAERFHGAVAMYHDQGHVVTKTLAFDLGEDRKLNGVNITLGLPICRTSVDHGTGYDIAWKKKADCHSLLDAMEVACRVT